ncbi:MAG TPA: 2OG-Fe(II) oxygenase family protein [Allosphingosinicella sp.]|nr:2OG-Fe(II) oxygenase family protein [Allosphingosinicella sp.]
MSKVIKLFELNPALDARALAERFAADGRLQIRDFLTAESASTVHQILARGTRWGLAWQAGSDGPHSIRAEALRGLSSAQREEISRKVATAARSGEYAFLYGQYPMVHAYLQKWAPGGPHDLLLEHINDQPLLDLVRAVTGIPELVKADAQATLYAPGQFLALHTDSHKAEGWRVAYVMSFCAADWRPDWGGYLTFYDEEGDVIHGLKPRFNALNIFKVPQGHSVTYVPSFAPAERFAITGWFRDT